MKSVIEKIKEPTGEIPTFEINEKLVLTNVDVKVETNIHALPSGRAFQNIFGELIIGVTEDKALVIKLYKDEE